MTPRERYLETILFGTPDKIPFQPGGPRESTLAAWRSQGLKDDVPWFTQLLEAVGIEPEPETPATYHEVSFRMIPEFEERILEHRDGHYILQDCMGAVVEISDCYDASYIRAAKDFVTRRWHRFPVETRDDFDAVKWRYDPRAPERYPADLPVRLDRLADPSRAYVSRIHVNGPFWQLREWCGFEGLCTLFMDDPDFVAEMADFWAGFVADVLEAIARPGTLDVLHISEDMAYKEHSMISPAMVREYISPAYKRWIAIAKASGCRVFDVDSDGHVGELIPEWIAAGINCNDPVEVAAGNDIVEYRRTFGREMAYTGGIDKRKIARGGTDIEEELRRVTPLLEDGGFIPSCDHGVPPDISWPAFIEYSRLLAGYCGWS